MRILLLLLPLSLRRASDGRSRCSNSLSGDEPSLSVLPVLQSNEGKRNAPWLLLARGGAECAKKKEGEDALLSRKARSKRKMKQEL